MPVTHGVAGSSPVQTASKKASEKSGAFLFVSRGKVTNIMTNIFQLD
jgi:hypothetical protein